MSEFHVVIPARYQSTRLPGKPLALVAGKPMIVCVAEQAQRCGAHSVTIATDDLRIVEAAAAAGHRALMTGADHQSGSDRLVEIADQLGWSDDALLVNVQGDEPLIPPEVIRQVADALQDGTRSVVTLCEPILEMDVLLDPNAVKVVFDQDHRALYFSRAPIPYDRGAFGPTPNVDAGANLSPGNWWRHIGIYGYQLGVLRDYVAAEQSSYESLESLEQLRFLQAGVPVHVFPACASVPGGIDTPADLASVNALLAG
jgi:3-deoxy-manno-octulosonate cytidylyltransferase (CMP-KDO synthetase)